MTNTPLGATGPQVTISLIADSAKDERHTENYQNELRRTIKTLQAAGVQILTLVESHSSANSGSLFSGSFTTAVRTLNGSGRAAMGAWLQEQPGRKIRIKASDLEIEASTSGEAERIFSRIVTSSAGYDEKI